MKKSVIILFGLISAIAHAESSLKVVGIAECMPDPGSNHPAHQSAVVEKVYPDLYPAFYRVTISDFSNLNAQPMVFKTYDDQADGSIRFEYKTLRANIINRTFELNSLHQSAFYSIESAYGKKSVGEFVCKRLSIGL